MREPNFLRGRRGAASFATAIAVLLLAPGSGAAQANADDLALPEPTLVAPHCAVAAEPSVDGESSAIVRAGCFATEREAQDFGAYGVASTSDLSSSEAAASSILLGQDHTGKYRSGSSLSFYGSGPSCSSTVSYKFKLYSPWNNVFSSAMVASYTACTYGHHYDYQNWTGDRKRCFELDCADSLDALDNRASSIWYRNST